MKSKKYYAYVAGNEKGVAESWTECEEMVKGVPGAKFKSFGSEEEAKQWLLAGADYSVKQVGLEPGIYFDAGTGAGNGVEINVTDENGKSLLTQALPKKEINKRGFYLLSIGATNNFGELTACKFAIEIALKNNIKKVFGDSKLVVEFWSKGYIKKENVSKETVSLAEAVKKLRKKFEMQGGELILISGGRNPADLGFHKGI